MATVPTWPSLTEGQWNLVATDVTSGTLHRLKSEFTFWRTYVATGAAAPLAAIKDKSPKIFQDSSVEKISNADAIDVYIWIENTNEDTDITSANAIEVNI